MENTLLVAVNRQDVLKRKMSLIANNIANMNTTGYKGGKMMFTEYLVRSRGGETVFGDRISFVRDIATVRDTSEGPLNATENPLDLAIRGEGFFVIATKEGERYTRNGHFNLNQEGQMVTGAGDPVLSSNGQPFYFSTQDSEINIARDGAVSTENGDLGKIRVVRFDNEQDLQQTAAGLYTSEAPAQDVEKPDLMQQMLEGSNVQPIIEITKMINVSRAYNSAKAFIDKEDDRIKRMMGEITRPV
ncbi:MAG TPA: flagellar basal-body rod protein FlgF [Rhodospirillales bacterium]|nr:flagellar basal-body rod protein FlgF [Rhodospirillales bacterium]